jgi:hypothetical protein
MRLTKTNPQEGQQQPVAMPLHPGSMLCTLVAKPLNQHKKKKQKKQ